MVNLIEHNRQEGFRIGVEVGVKLAEYGILEHVIDHPEIGAVLDSQCGAQSDGCTFDTPDRAEENAPEWLGDLLSYCRKYIRPGSPWPIRAVLASDGWWWKV